MAPTPAPTPAPIVKTEAPTQVAVILQAMVTPKQVTEKCSWVQHCPIYKNEEEHKEDWDGNMQRATKDVPTKYSVPPAPKHAATPITKYSAPPATEQSALQVI